MAKSRVTRSMQRRKFIFPDFAKIVAGGLLASLALVSQASGQVMADEQNPEEIKFLQDIQKQLMQVSGMKYRPVSILVTRERKRKIDITPSSIIFSYGFLKNMKNINQLVATMAHMTAHISLDDVSRPHLPENHTGGSKNTSLEKFIATAILQRYPDEGYMPQATGAFHDKNNGMEIIERPGYQNREYNFAVNKADIIKEEHELEADKITDKIMRHSGFCPSDYTRLLHYFYENPQKLLGNKHFPLDADQWQRIDVVDRRADPDATCSDAQIAMTQKHAGAFYRLKVRILQTGKTKGNPVPGNLLLSRSFLPEALPDLP